VRRYRRVASASVVSALLLTTLGYQVGVLATRAAAVVPSVSVTGPVSAGTPTLNGTLYGTYIDVAQLGYQRSEFFMSGTAHSYVPVTPLTSDGNWNVTTGASAPYTTRILVYRPVDPTKFNGTVIVEWLNVSGGIDDSPEWTLAHNELVREGFAWVGVSAQKVGVDAARKTDPTDYASLSHPGDSFSYDIFSQAGEVVRADAPMILGNLKPRTVLAAGESQSAFRLMTYIDAVQPTADVYNGFLVHSQFGTGAALSQAPQPLYATPKPTTIRSNLGVPVLEFETETDVYNSNLTDRTFYGDPKNFRLWEVAGSSHYDYYGLSIGFNDTGNGQDAVENLAAMQHPTNTPVGGFVCGTPINTGGTHWVLDAAVYRLNQWVVNGTPPPTAPYLQTTQSSPVVFALDANGNALGGVRSPQVDAPLAALGGVGNIPFFCTLFGTTVPLSSARLASLYPTHAQFVFASDLATYAAVVGGYLVRQDGVDLINAATASQVG